MKKRHDLNPIVKFKHGGAAYVTADDLFRQKRVIRDIRALRKILQRHSDPTDAKPRER